MAETMSNDNNQKNRSQEPPAQIVGIPRNELEKQLISSFLLDPSLVSKHSLNPSEFITADLRLLYQAIVKAKDDGSIDWGLLVKTPSDPNDPIIDLIDEQCKKLAKIAGVESWLVRKVATTLPSPVDCDQYIARLRELNKASPDKYVIKTVGKRGKVSLSVDIAGLKKDFMAEFTFKTIPGTKGNDDILVYQDGVYTYNGETVIREECEKRVPTSILTTHNVREVRDHIARDTFAEREDFNTQKYIINLRNGLLDARTLELRPHSPDFLSTIQIPLTYDPGAKCPKIMKFLGEVLPSKNIQTMLEYFGYLLLPDYSIPIVLILYGPAGSGKSTLLNLMGNYIGKDNWASTSLHALQYNEFAASDLIGKLLNTQGDLSQEWFGDTGLLKQLSGRDLITANVKFKDPVRFFNIARLAFSSNKPPKLSDETKAVWRRIVPIKMPNAFEGKPTEKKDILEGELALPEELSGLLNLALEDGLHTIMLPNGNFGNFTNVGTMEERAEEYIFASDPIKAFITDHCETDPNDQIPKSELYPAYKLFCEVNDKEVPFQTQFGKDIMKMPGVGERHPTIEGIRVWVYTGIKLKPGAIKTLRDKLLTKGMEGVAPEWF